MLEDLSHFLPAVLLLRANRQLPPLLRQIKRNADIAVDCGFEVIIKSLPDWAYRDWCKIQDISSNYRRKSGETTKLE